MKHLLGLSPNIVCLQPHTDLWSMLFVEEKERLDAAIGPYVLDIQHVGSTAIPDIPAKPILDIGVAVNNFEEASCCIAPLEKIGYLYHGENGIPRRHFFSKGAPRTHNLHMNEIESDDWQCQIAFRDFLRQCPPRAAEYAELKKQLARQFPTDRLAYTEGKSGFISHILQQVLPQTMLKTGSMVIVRSYRADGTCYRWRKVLVEDVQTGQIKAFAKPGTQIHDLGSTWLSKNFARATYWFDRPYNLLEFYNADGIFDSLYVNIASPIRIKDGEIHYTDYELDVLQRVGCSPELLDEDEFTEAIDKFDYSKEFQAHCYQIVEEVTELLPTWQIGGLPLGAR